MIAVLSRRFAVCLVPALMGALSLAFPTLGAEAPACTAIEGDSGNAAACELAEALERTYTYPQIGKAYAQALREGIAQGRYVGADKDAIASKMTADLQTVASDGHLRVRVRQKATPPNATTPSPKPSFPILEEAGWLTPGIAYIRINEFPDDPDVTREVAKFMVDHADAQALIFDLRTHHGGGIAQMDAILPWLFAKPTRVVTMETSWDVERELGSPVDGVASMRLLDDTRMARREHWVTPNEDPRLRDAKVYVLTGPRTASAAEHFALALKRTGRATLVGGATAGANHFGGQVDLAGGYFAFVPVGRTFDPDTGKDWETDGVTPDIAIEPAMALELALTELGVAPHEARALSQAHSPTLSMERRPN